MIQECCRALNSSQSALCNNASWALGMIAPHFVNRVRSQCPTILAAHVRGMETAKPPLLDTLVITIGIIGRGCPDLVASVLHTHGKVSSANHCHCHSVAIGAIMLNFSSRPSKTGLRCLDYFWLLSPSVQRWGANKSMFGHLQYDSAISFCHSAVLFEFLLADLCWFETWFGSWGSIPTGDSRQTMKQWYFGDVLAWLFWLILSSFCVHFNRYSKPTSKLMDKHGISCFSPTKLKNQFKRH